MSFGEIYDIKYKNLSLRFIVQDPADVIQSCHVRGCFYEVEELEYLSTILPPKSIVLDIGANVGNHSIYFATVCRCEIVIPFEVNPPAIEILRRNINLNGLTSIDTSYLGKALGAQTGFVRRKMSKEHNLGAEAFEESAAASADGYPMISIDSLGLNRCDFAKIDVEGMEFSVLDGMTETIKRFRPMLFIEVRRKDLDRFNNHMREFDYRVERTFQRYLGVYTFFCFPNSLRGHAAAV